MKELEFRGVSVAFGTPLSPVFEQMSFDVERGEVISLVGPSGCGKTTTLAVLGGFLRPSSGSALMRGVEIRGASHERGLVFQEHCLFPWLTVRGNVAFGPRMQGAGKSEQQVAVKEWLKRVGLEGQEDKYPFELSVGMMQRVGIARVLAAQPDVLLLDEPFAALDTERRYDLQDMLLSLLNDRTRTAVVATHDLEEAVFLSDRVFVFGTSPKGIREVLRVGLPRSRQPELRYESEFTRLKAKLVELVRAEIRSGSATPVGQTVAPT
ncbi:MAG: Taurine import ATP-binding protein TauB [Chromatiales bacterium USCg_Taylor]|nr:MAG: Taurine import ATP-binding protein TauB [Chromatiales bacterium USCg_Taylor]